MVEAPDLPDAQIDQWVAGLAARIGRGLDTRNGVTLAATLVDRGASMPPVVVAALHPCVADQAGLALLLTELHAALQSGTAAVALSDDPPNYGDWLSWLHEHADQQHARPRLPNPESHAHRPP